MAISERASLAFPRLLEVASSIADEVYTHARLPENPSIKSGQKKMSSKVPVAGSANSSAVSSADLIEGVLVRVIRFA